MTVFQPVRCATLLIPSGPAHDFDKEHLLIILTDPVADPFNGGKDSVLLTSLSTLDTALPHDPTCILHPGDHPFITRESYVTYHASRIQETTKIVNGVVSGVFVVEDPMESSIVDRICDGLSISPHTAKKIKRFFRIYAAQQSST